MSPGLHFSRVCRHKYQGCISLKTPEQARKKSMLALQGRLLHLQVSAAASAPLPIPANQVLTGFPTRIPVSKSPPAPPHKPPVCPSKSKEPPLHTCKPSLHPGSPPQPPIQCW